MASFTFLVSTRTLTKNVTQSPKSITTPPRYNRKAQGITMPCKPVEEIAMVKILPKTIPKKAPKISPVKLLNSAWPVSTLQAPVLVSPQALSSAILLLLACAWAPWAPATRTSVPNKEMRTNANKPFLIGPRFAKILVYKLNGCLCRHTVLIGSRFNIAKITVCGNFELNKIDTGPQNLFSQLATHQNGLAAPRWK